MENLFTSEAVSWGHPDRLCDTIVNTILEHILSEDPNGHAGLEAFAAEQFLLLGGEVSYKCKHPIDFETITRTVVGQIGYKNPAQGFDSSSLIFLNKVAQQSSDIALGVNAETSKFKLTGAGDQGIMFGYATNETDAGLPVSAYLANALMYRFEQVQLECPHFFYPDAKSQVTVDYDSKAIDSIVLSVSHADSLSKEEVQSLVIENILKPVIDSFKSTKVGELYDTTDITLFINPTGRFVVHGPAGDSGLSGRKLVVDSYGGIAPIGGGNTNGKDPTKVDASAARAARHIALNLVKAGVCDECLIQVAYAIGVPDPVSINLSMRGAKVDEDVVAAWVHKDYPLSVEGMIQNLKLTSQDYSRCTLAGQFGVNSELLKSLEYNLKLPDFSWERLDWVDRIKEELL